MSKVLVTGGSGFLGSHLVRAIEEGGGDVQYTYRSQPLKSVTATGIELDLTKPEGFSRNSRQLEEVTHLVHAAATVQHNRDDILQDLHDQITLSVEGFHQLISALPNLKRIVYVSSGSAALADTDPTFYGLGKLLMEGVVARVAAVREVPYVSLRFPQLFGSGEPHGIFITKFWEMLQAGNEITLANDGAVTKDVLYIDDAVGSIRRALQDDVTSGIYTITMEQACTVWEVLDALVEATKLKARVTSVTVSDEEIKAKSFHLASTAGAMGYKLQYNVRQGIEAYVKGAAEERHV